MREETSATVFAGGFGMSCASRGWAARGSSTGSSTPATTSSRSDQRWEWQTYRRSSCARCYGTSAANAAGHRGRRNRGGEEQGGSRPRLHHERTRNELLLLLPGPA